MNLKKIKDSKSQYSQFKERVTDIAELKDYSVDIEEQEAYRTKEVDVVLTFSKYTSFGQDFSAIVFIPKSSEFESLKNSLLDNLYEYVQDFDPYEEADKWSEVVDYDEEGNEIREGRNGAPTEYDDIVADMQEAKEDLEDLYKSLREKL